MSAGPDLRRGAGATLGGALAALSPFDLGRPIDGWTDLHLRPLLLVTGALAVLMVAVGRSSVDRPLALATMALVGGFAIASLASPDPTTGLAVTARVAVLGLVFAASAATFTDAGTRRGLVIGLAVGAGLASAIGLAVLARGSDRWGTELLLGTISVSRGVTRLTRPFSHANVAAMYLAPAAVLLTAAATPTGATGPIGAPGGADDGVRMNRSGRIVLGAVAILTAAAVSLTLSRSGMLALVVAAGALVVLQIRARLAPGVNPRPGPMPAVAGLPLLVIVVALVVGVRSGRWGPRLDSTAIGSAPPAPSRPRIWSQAIEALVDHPLTGVGPGRFGVYARSVTATGETAAAHAHNPILEAAATGGLVALAGVVVFGLVVIGRSWSGRAAVPVGLSAALGATMVPMVADIPFLFSSSGNLVALIAGAWYAAGRAGTGP